VPDGPAVADPILASKITVPDVPGFAVQRPRISEFACRGHPVEPADYCHWAPRDRQNDGSDVLGSSGEQACGLGRPGPLRQPVRSPSGPTWSRPCGQFRHCPSEALSADTREQQPITCSCFGLCQPWLARNLPVILVSR